jgi:ribonuclease R
MSKKKNSSSIVKVLTQMVLDIFEQNGNTPLNYKQVSAKLNVRDPDSRDIIFGILRDETKTGALKEVAPGKWNSKPLLKVKLT